MSRAIGPKEYAALIAVWVFWGTTYLAIRIALENLPPAFVICSRFLISGSLLLIFARLKGAHLPRGRELRVACVSGLLTLGLGTGGLVFAEVMMPSGLASLFITISPFWMIGLDALAGGEPLRRRTVLGMLVGFAGTVLLLTPGATGDFVTRPILIGSAILQVGLVGWTVGSLYQRSQPSLAHPIVTGAVQQLTAGIVYLPVALLLRSQPTVLTTRGVLAILYLVVFGSIIAYSAYVYTMERLPVAIASLYSYFNAAVAVFLGWLLLREPFGWREFSGMLIIFAGVAIVKTQGAPKTARASR